MKTRQYFSRARALATCAFASLGSLVLSTGALAQDSTAPAEDLGTNSAREEIVVVAAPAAKITHHAQPIVTLMGPELLPETPEQRLDRVAYHLRAASGGRCARPEMLTGFALHETGAYDANERALVERFFHFGKAIGVRHIVLQSAAARSGFLAGDVITHVNGREVASFSTDLIGHRASYNRTARFESFLESALREGPAQITIRRGKTTRTLALPGQPGCGGKPVYYEKGGLNAWADGKYLAVTDKMMKFASDDNELAFVISHEMAHNILDHAAKIRGRSMLLAMFGIGSGVIKNTEIEADELGVEILVSAGFSLEGAQTVLRRAGKKYPLNLATTHPGFGRRIGLVTAAAERYEQRIQAARAEREQPPLVAGLKDLGYMARSLTVPNLTAVLPNLPVTGESTATRLAGQSAAPKAPERAEELASAALATQNHGRISSISFTRSQEAGLSKTFASVRSANA